MRSGEVLCIATGKLGFDWKEKWTDEKIFPASTVFDFKAWRDNDKETYKPWVKEEDNYGIGGINHGFGFTVQQDFTLCIVSEGTEEELKTIMDSLPAD